MEQVLEMMKTMQKQISDLEAEKSKKGRDKKSRTQKIGRAPAPILVPR